ncbi:MAG TPA: hypothetical protein VN951_12975 [Pyrinomonadaceae bacterium]|nr:hypothetical protein [Pyrinomonadaceae bacterium]
MTTAAKKIVVRDLSLVLFAVFADGAFGLKVITEELRLASGGNVKLQQDSY